MFQSCLLKEICWLGEEQGWIELHSGELHNLNSPPQVIKMTKPDRMKMTAYSIAARDEKYLKNFRSEFFKAKVQWKERA
jgi:hypothetical protein